MVKTFAQILGEWTRSWGLRGDPGLWDAIHNLVGQEEAPPTVEEFMTRLEQVFQEIVGQPISTKIESVYIEEFNHGGMSGGSICIPFGVIKHFLN